MCQARGEKLVLNRILAGIFGGFLILAGIATLVVGSMLYMTLYVQYKDIRYESMPNS